MGLRFLKPFTDRRKALELIVGIGLLLAMSGLAATHSLDPVEHLLLDLRFKIRGEKPFPPGITLIGIDESSLDRLGHWPWPRDKHAVMVSLLDHPSFRPKVLAYDILFEDRNPLAAAGDDTLADRMKNFSGNLLLPYFYEKGHISPYEIFPEREDRLADSAITKIESVPEGLDEATKVSLPFLELTETNDTAFVTMPIDPDGRTRRTQLLVKFNGKIYPSLALLVSLQYLDSNLEDVTLQSRAIVIQTQAGKKIIPIDEKGELLINYYGGISDDPNLLGYPFIVVLEAGKSWMSGGKVPEMLRGLKDKIVLLGVTAQGVEDRRVTPFNQYEYGIRLHAQIIANILQDDYLVRAKPSVSYGALFLTGILMILITMFTRITRSLPALLVLGLLYFGVSYLFFLSGIWVDVVVQEIAMVVIFIGITSFRYFTALEELRRTQEQLIQSTKMASLGQLSAGISHEFRNILNAVNLHVEYVSRPGTAPEKVTKYLGVIKDIMTNANLILNGLLTFARKSESVKTPGNLKKTVEDTLLLIQKEMLRHEIAVKTELQEVPEIAYDSGQVSQVIMNLMNNSRDALKDRSEKEITLGLRSDVKGVWLDIGDNGSGIPPQVLKRLFEPFVTSKPAGKGTGLGLSVCHGIIRNHGGDITVTTAQGKGTTWHIFFPKH